MGLTVIPSSVAGLLPAKGASGNTASDAAAGDFAALLSSELLDLTGIQAIPGEALGKGLRQINGDGPDDLATLDPALMATLFGHGESRPLATPAQPGTTARPEDILNARGGRPAADDGELGARLSNRPDLAAQPAERAKPNGSSQATPAIPATPAAMTDRNGPANSFGAQLAANLRAPAANIAGERGTAELPPAANVAAMSGGTATASGLEQRLPGGEARPVVHAQLHSAAWPQQFGDKIVWLARNDQQSAQLTINPPQLGPIQISLNLSGDQASIAFASPHAEVRQAIESAMPHLRDMLSSAGINLGQSNVGAQLAQRQDENPFAGANGQRSPDENAILPANDKAADAAGSPILHRGRGLVDLFA